MPHYQAYGLRIDSALELPELIAVSSGSASADVTFQTKKIDLDDPELPKSDDALGGETVGIHYPRIAAILVTAGRLVEIDVFDGADPRIVRLILLGPILGLLLHQRGYLVLHASAVDIQFGCVAFIGDKGAGKSTTAAAFNARGYALVADDLLAVSPGSHLVYPGFPQLKLWREAAEHLTSGCDMLPKLHPDLDKVGLRVPERFAAAPLPLRRIYSLADGERVAIEALRSAEAFMELVRHSYAIRLIHPTGSAQSHFKQAVELAGKIPVRKLVRPRNLELLNHLVDAVVADAE